MAIIELDKETALKIQEFLGIDYMDYVNYSVIRAVVDLMITYIGYQEYKKMNNNIAFGIKDIIATTYETYHIERWLCSLYNLVKIIKDVDFPFSFKEVNKIGGFSFNSNADHSNSFLDNLRFIRNKNQHEYASFYEVMNTHVLIGMCKDEFISRGKKMQKCIINYLLDELKNLYGEKFYISSGIHDVFYKD